MSFDALEDFAGPGGWDEGARLLGLRFYGIDYDGPACETARAAGHHREQADVTEHVSPEWARGKGHVSSPSCTLFSMAGSGVGRLVIDVLVEGLARILRGDDPAAVRAKTQAAIYPVALAEVEKGNAKRKPEKRWDAARVEAKARLDAKVAALVLETARRIVELDPEWVAFEQVPEVLPLWQVIARELRARGWSVWCGIMNAADYGVPQTRRRAILIGSQVRQITPPAPTHAEHPQDDDLFGGKLLPWVTFSEAMQDAGFWEWTGDELIIPARGAGMNERHGTRPAHPTSEPAPTIIPKARSWVVDRRTNSKAAGGGIAPTVAVPVTRPAPTLTGKSGTQWVIRPNETAPVYVNGNQPNAGRRSADEPAPTILFGKRHNDTRWVFDRPATTVVGSFKPDVIAAPGYRTTTSRQDAPGSVSVSVSVSEAGVLQSFPADHPWRGSRSKQYEQVGNAIPPLLAAHVLAAATGLSFNQETS